MKTSDTKGGFPTAARLSPSKVPSQLTRRMVYYWGHDEMPSTLVSVLWQSLFYFAHRNGFDWKRMRMLYFTKLHCKGLELKRMRMLCLTTKTKLPMAPFPASSTRHRIRRKQKKLLVKGFVSQENRDKGTGLNEFGVPERLQVSCQHTWAFPNYSPQKYARWRWQATKGRIISRVIAWPQWNRV